MVTALQATRLRGIRLLASVLAAEPGVSLCTVRELEQRIHETCKSGEYRERVRELAYGLGTEDVRGRVRDLLVRPGGPGAVARLPLAKLRSQQDVAWYVALEDEVARDQRRVQELEAFDLSAGEAASGPALNRCSKCQGTRVRFYQQQTRSSDEGMTTFLQCLNPDCGKRWKQ